MQDLQQAYVLHRYPYQERHFLFKVFTRNDGLLTCIGKYVKRSRSPWCALLQPFQCLFIRYRGRSQILSLTEVEQAGLSFVLDNHSLWAGFYLNELLLAFLLPHDAHSRLFDAYSLALKGISSSSTLEQSLRIFEMSLFHEIGCLSDFTLDENGDPLDNSAFYQLLPHHLPKKIDCLRDEVSSYIFQGRDLLEIQALHFSDLEVRKAAKRFSRLHLQFYLPQLKLKTREVFAQILGES